LPEAILFRLDPPLAAVDYAPSKPVQGFALCCFGPPASQGDGSGATHLLLVNLDYKQEQTTTVVGPMPWESFDPATGKWIAAGGKRVELRLSPGGGKLLRAGG